MNSRHNKLCTIKCMTLSSNTREETDKPTVTVNLRNIRQFSACLAKKISKMNIHTEGRTNRKIYPQLLRQKIRLKIFHNYERTWTEGQNRKIQLNLH